MVLLAASKWCDCFSCWFNISARVRPGGVLSPDLYSIYVDDLIQKLIQLNKGCYYANLFAAALFYADDMALLAPSIKGLQCMLDVCYAYCEEWDIGLNSKKTKNLYFGKPADNLYNVTMNGAQIHWEKEWPYLGVMLRSGKTFGCSVDARIKKLCKCHPQN